MAKYVLDTNVYIHAMRNQRARVALAAWQRRMAPQIYQHAVVIAELLVGARDKRTFDRWRERWVAPAERIGRVITPVYGSWVRAAAIVARLVESGSLRLGGVASTFFNDCLIAASVRDHGFTLVTHNLGDFIMIQRVEPHFAFVAPFP